MCPEPFREEVINCNTFSTQGEALCVQVGNANAATGNINTFLGTFSTAMQAIMNIHVVRIFLESRVNQGLQMSSPFLRR